LLNSNTHKLLAKPWVYHSLFWIAYYIFAALISLSIHQIHDPRFYWQLLTLVPPDMLLVYANFYLLTRLGLLRKQWGLYIVTLLACLVLLSALNIFLHRLYARAASPIFASSSDFNGPNFATRILNGIYLLGLATAFKFGKDWIVQRQQLQEIEKQQVETELAFLKSQVNPHFFFNTLNNLYSLTLQKSDLAPEVVLKLSGLMSYMLYDSGAALVPLDKEVSILENYIALEELRFGSRLRLHFDKSGLASHPAQIPPLILLTLVENSFKHGMSRIIGEGRIELSLRVNNSELQFQIDNPICSAGQATQEKNGIGLRNVIRRLDLLYGPRYHLLLSETDNHFHVTLKLPLA
jgi:two-component system, LytTR family, sensor kinase